jgi:fumarate reductase subunit D
MMKIILANYLLTALCITIAPAIDAFMGRLGTQAPDVGNAIGQAVANKTIITLILYLLLFLLLFAKSRLHIGFHLSGIKKIFMTILCIPMTVLSIALTLEIAVL